MKKFIFFGVLVLAGCNPAGKVTVASVESAILTAGQLYCMAPDGIKAPLGIVAQGQSALDVAMVCATLGGAPVALPGGNVAIQIIAPPLMKD